MFKTSLDYERPYLTKTFEIACVLFFFCGVRLADTESVGILVGLYFLASRIMREKISVADELPRL